MIMGGTEFIYDWEKLAKK